MSNNFWYSEINSSQRKIIGLTFNMWRLDLSLNDPNVTLTAYEKISILTKIAEIKTQIRYCEECINYATKQINRKSSFT